jgi:hypothetical protein
MVVHLTLLGLRQCSAPILDPFGLPVNSAGFTRDFQPLSGTVLQFTWNWLALNPLRLVTDTRWTGTPYDSPRTLSPPAYG